MGQTNGTQMDIGILIPGLNGIVPGEMFQYLPLSQPHRHHKRRFMENLGNKLRLAYYEASDGPRIMLFGPLDANFVGLKYTFDTLSKSEESTYIEDLEFVKSFGVSLHCSCVGSMFENTEYKMQGVCEISNKVFYWRKTAEGWDYLSKLIEGLISNPTSGHQYLTSYPSEDAIVVISKGEYEDAILDKN